MAPLLIYSSCFLSQLSIKLLRTLCTSNCRTATCSWPATLRLLVRIIRILSLLRLRHYQACIPLANTCPILWIIWLKSTAVVYMKLYRKRHSPSIDSFSMYATALIRPLLPTFIAESQQQCLLSASPGTLDTVISYQQLQDWFYMLLGQSDISLT